MLIYIIFLYSLWAIFKIFKFINIFGRINHNFIFVNLDANVQYKPKSGECKTKK